MREAQITIRNVDYEQLGIEKLVSLCREAGLRDFEELACRGDGSIVQVELESRIEPSQLDALEYVDQWELVTDSDGCLYIIGFTAPALSNAITDHAEELVGTCDPEIGELGAMLTFVGPQDAIRGLISEYADAGLSPDLRKLGEYDGPDRPLKELTDRQREVLEVAFGEGYYEVPRQASTEDIAAKLEVDSSTVAEHLQRAERNLLTQHLSAMA